MSCKSRGQRNGRRDSDPDGRDELQRNGEELEIERTGLVSVCRLQRA